VGEIVVFAAEGDKMRFPVECAFWRERTRAALHERQNIEHESGKALSLQLRTGLFAVMHPGLLAKSIF
jgi:hypothetical protein